MNFHQRILPLAIAATVLVTGAARADVTFEAPGSNNCFPFACAPMNYQQVYSASGFSGPVDIYGISFKTAQDGFGHAMGPTPVTLTIDFSTTGVTPTTITGNFAANRGSDDKIVFSGTATLSSSGGNVFDITIPFTSSFRFDPNQGNLLVGMNVTQGWQITAFEANRSTLMGRNYNGSAGAEYGLSTRFLTTPIPEPETWAMMASGLLLLGAVARKRQREKQTT